jgi:HSP20 family molecular chaperone IbpA
VPGPAGDPNAPPTRRQFGGPDTQAWAPPVDITERKDAYLVAVELPGVGIDNLEIAF